MAGLPSSGFTLPRALRGPMAGVSRPSGTCCRSAGFWSCSLEWLMSLERSNRGASGRSRGQLSCFGHPWRCHMKATDLLKKQHREVESLFKKMEKSEGAEDRRDLMEQIKMFLEAHTTIEEEIFYPAVAELETKKAGEMVNEAFEEHHVVKLVLKELPSVDPEDERFDAKMT